MVRYRRTLAAGTPIVLLLSSRTWDDIPFRDELFALERDLPDFGLILALTGEPARRAGDFERRVDAAMIRESAARLSFDQRHVFICGSNGFVNAAADGAVAGGIPASMIRTERYGG
jgi:ferredoxin-NADP reductase